MDTETTETSPLRRALSPFRRGGLLGLAVLALTFLVAACGDDPISPDDPELTEVGVVVNSTDNSMTIFPVEEPEATETVGLGPDGSPVGMSVLGDRALVPMGTVPAVAVVDLRHRTHSETLSLPEGSGASGSAFVNDTLALVANPGLNTVSVVNPAEESVGEEIPTGGYPQEVVVGEGRVFVLNAELDENFQPEGPGTLTVLDASDLSEVGTVELSGENPGGAAFGPDGLLYVVTSGSFGEDNGALAVVDPAVPEEIAFHEGFGDFPSPVAVGPDGQVHVGSFSYGVAVWDPADESFARAPDDAVAPGGIPSTSGVAFDSEGRFYAVTPECEEPGHANRMDASDYEVDVEIPTGTCPFGIAFSDVRDP